ncbi:MAG: hypothetical protein LBD13_03415 [Spirochaetaceae bacterium]|nr:hypothetical protein [Spirochaetaceae bacterium]
MSVTAVGSKLSLWLDAAASAAPSSCIVSGYMVFPAVMFIIKSRKIRMIFRRNSAISQSGYSSIMG